MLESLFQQLKIMTNIFLKITLLFTNESKNKSQWNPESIYNYAMIPEVLISKQERFS